MDELKLIALDNLPTSIQGQRAEPAENRKWDARQPFQGRLTRHRKPWRRASFLLMDDPVEKVMPILCQNLHQSKPIPFCVRFVLPPVGQSPCEADSDFDACNGELNGIIAFSLRTPLPAMVEPRCQILYQPRARVLADCRQATGQPADCHSPVRRSGLKWLHDGERDAI